MFCNVCQKKEAVVHYAEIVNGQMKKMDLCEACAVDKGVGTNVSINMTDLLTEATETTSEGKESQPKETCSSCNMTYSDFKKSGRLGCCHCYQAFGRSLAPLLETIHHSSRHVGKTPNRESYDSFNFEQSQRLREELQQAITNEEYEKAAQIRDQVRELEKSQKKKKKK